MGVEAGAGVLGGLEAVRPGLLRPDVERPSLERVKLERSEVEFVRPRPTRPELSRPELLRRVSRRPEFIHPDPEFDLPELIRPESALSEFATGTGRDDPRDLGVGKIEVGSCRPERLGLDVLVLTFAGRAGGGGGFRVVPVLLSRLANSVLLDLFLARSGISVLGRGSSLSVTTSLRLGRFGALRVR